MGEYEEVKRPEELGQPPYRWTQAIHEVGNPFPIETGFGGHGLRPRALARVSVMLLEWLVVILMHAEASGLWRETIRLVIIVLPLKPDGGFRPIGLLPMLAPLWVRVRRGVLVEWEQEQHLSYPYAGSGMGLTVAAWKQSARAELAATVKVSVQYAQALLDLIKAFDCAPH